MVASRAFHSTETMSNVAGTKYNEQKATSDSLNGGTVLSLMTNTRKCLEKLQQSA